MGQVEQDANHRDSADGVGRQQASWGIYEGSVNRGSSDQYGRAIWPNGDSYIGLFKNGKMNGKGNYTMKNGTSIESFWKDG